MNLQNAHKEMVEWMQAFGQETPDKITIPFPDILELRLKLIQEECYETIEALAEIQTYPTPIKYENVIDGLGDSLFVIIGTLVALGVDTQAVWNEILESNWTKFWTGFEIESEFDIPESIVAANTLENEKYKAVMMCPTDEIAEKDTRNWLVKNEHGKVIKSPSFTPPDLKRFIPKELQK